MPATGVDGQVWLDTDGTLAGQDFVPLSGGTMIGNLNVPSINSGPIVGRNKILNGDFSIWQRGTSGGNGFLADRWYLNAGAATSFSQSRQSFTPGSAPVAGYEGKYFWRNSITNVGSETAWYLNTYIEDVQTLAGQTTTFSFFAKADSNRTISAYMLQRFGTGGSSNVSTTIGTFSLTTTWQRYTATFTMPSLSGKTIGTDNLVQMFFAMNPASGLVLDLWGMQWEAGNQATPYHNATPNQQTELAACQRYYYRNTAGSQGYNPLSQLGITNTTSQVTLQMQNPVRMRADVHTVDHSGLSVYGGSPAGGVGFASVSSVVLTRSTPEYVELGVQSSGLTIGSIYRLQPNLNTNAYIGFSAEL
jgi:hypothetical protein